MHPAKHSRFSSATLFKELASAEDDSAAASEPELLEIEYIEPNPERMGRTWLALLHTSSQDDASGAPLHRIMPSKTL
jgi:hypothetical protein